MNATLVAFAAYLLIVLVIGLVTFRANKSHADYFLGGRKMNPLLVAFSERTSGESAWLLLGMPGVAYSMGMSEIWTVFGCIGGIIFSWFVIAKDIRIETERIGSITLPTFFADKFDKDDKVLRFTSMLIIIFFFTFYLAAQFNGAGKVLRVSFDIPELYGIVIGAVVIIFYTMMGGFLAVVWTDLVQGIIMIFALIVLPITAFIGMSTLHPEALNTIVNSNNQLFSLTGDKTGWAAISVVIAGLSWGLGYMGQPHLVTKYMSISEPSRLNEGRRIAIAWALPAFFGAFLIGIFGISIFGTDRLADVEYLMPKITYLLMPDFIAGVIISGAIAAMMSTADSQLLVISSTIIEDFYHRALKKDVSKKKLLIMSRTITLSVGIAAFIIAISSTELIYYMVSYAWTGLGSAFGPALLLMLKWKRTTKSGVLAGMLTGSITTVVWTNITFLNDWLNVRFVSFVLAFAAVIIFSSIKIKLSIPHRSV